MSDTSASPTSFNFDSCAAEWALRSARRPMLQASTTSCSRCASSRSAEEREALGPPVAHVRGDFIGRVDDGGFELRRSGSFRAWTACIA